MSRKKNRPHRTGPAGAAPEAHSQAIRRRPLSLRRRWLYRFLAATLVPAVVLLVLEGGLRLFGYGRPTGFSIQEEVGSRTCYTYNPCFNGRFYPTRIARRPETFAYPVAKDANTCRIFVLGSSAAQGDPDPAYGFSRILRVMLRDQYPGVRFEVVNTAAAAVNSHVVREVAADCAAHDPDLFVVYLGNNEVVGPFGAGNSWAPFSRSLALIRAKLWLDTTKIGQLMGDLLGAGDWADEDLSSWRGMEMFLDWQVRADDAALQGVHGHFRANLEDICSLAARSGPPLILCTVAVNLRDCAPFASLHRRDLSQTDKVQWESIYQEGVTHESASRWMPAAERYLAAAAVDPQYAELYYRLARCYWSLGRYEKAKEAYVKARDLDTLRFRADTTINQTIRAVGTAFADRGVSLLDVADILATKSAHATPGRQWFYEHVHFNFEGNCAVAEAIFRQAAPLLPESIRRRQAKRPLPTAEECARRLAFSDHDRSATLGIVIGRLRRAPFTNQIDVQEQLLRLEMEREVLRPGRPAEAAADGATLYETAIGADPDDPTLRKKFGKYLLQLGGSPARAEQQLREALRLSADDDDTVHINLAAALDAEGRAQEAIEHLRRAIAISPDEPLAHSHLGLLLSEQGKPREAISHYEAALRVDAEYVKPLMLLAWLLATDPDPAVRDGPRAVELGQRACRVTENRNPEALDILAAAYAQSGRFADAISTAREALQLLPPEQRPLIDEVESRINRYEAEQPFRAIR